MQARFLLRFKPYFIISEQIAFNLLNDINKVII